MSPSRRARRSIRTIILTWLFLFSIVPLAFVTGYSVVKFKDAIDRSLSQRLQESFNKLESELEEFEQALNNKANRYVQDPSLIYGLSTNSDVTVQKLALSWVRNELASKLNIINREGKMIVSVTPGSTLKTVQEQLKQGTIELNDEFLSRVKEKNQTRFVEFIENPSGGVQARLVVFTKVTSRSGRLVGYIEQNLNLDDILEPLKKLLNLEIFVMNDKGRVFAASDEDIKRLAVSTFQSVMDQAKATFSEMPFKGDPYGIMLSSTTLGETKIYLGIAVSRRDMTEVLNNVNMAFLAVVGAIVALLAVTALVTTSWLLRPLDRLVEAVRTFKETGQPVTVPVTTETEIGVLSESFNELADAVFQSRKDLEEKIAELEQSHKELKEAQAKLVHTAKMASLGQLVAGVAHELNNPIGFIYSNMTHLREYSEKLVEFSEKITADQSRIDDLKTEYEYDFIREDLPKLIDSCEDGAKRTRDIVVGLRNFSRLDEAQVKTIDVNEALENTLQLLQGETKNRITVVREFGEIPTLECYATQINQVFMNLLSNAAQAIEGEGEIRVTTALKGDRIHICISDNGGGIPPELQEKIFDPFFTTKSIGKGTGLGLSISYRIVEKHGGEISLNSEVGKGTEFHITLPTDGINAI